MSTTQECSENRMVTRLVAAILFVLGIATGYVISAPVQGATAVVAADEDETGDSYLASSCAADGLVFSDCELEF